MKRVIDYSASKAAIFAAYLSAHRRLFALDMLLSLAVALVDLAFPYITRPTMNTLLPEQRFSAFFPFDRISLNHRIVGMLFHVSLKIRVGTIYVAFLVDLQGRAAFLSSGSTADFSWQIDVLCRNESCIHV